MASSDYTGAVEDTDVAACPQEVHRTVVLIGKTGNGKSTLANVLVGAHKQEPPIEVFKEGEYAASTTHNAQEHIANIDGRNYRVVDTIGIGDTGLSTEQVLMRIARICHYLRNGINQIIFVSNGRFTQVEQEAFDLLRRVLFDDDVCRFVTIVRTKSRFFQNESKCAADIAEMKGISSHTSSIVDSARKIIHVNNPNYDDYEDWVERREKIRWILLPWIEMCGDLYEPPNLTKIAIKVKDYVGKQERLEKEIELLKKQRKEMDEQHAEEVTKLKRIIADMKEALATNNHEIEQQIKRLEEKQERYRNTVREQGKRIGRLETELAESQKSMLSRIKEDWVDPLIEALCNRFSRDKKD